MTAERLSPSDWSGPDYERHLTERNKLLQKVRSQEESWLARKQAADRLKVLKPAIVLYEKRIFDQPTRQARHEG
jgi:hypothetical protein